MQVAPIRIRLRDPARSKNSAQQLDRLLDAEGKIISAWRMAKSGKPTPEWADRS
ncbi:hypothetical protein SUDANB121_00888 [Nocardiopsis dassonvillei]